ncbi:efflux RND transporter periplasmic adaptor subunit [Arsukibacterium indicum]|uniref:Efflux RND transporter periplasmic adaptor subunit n=1 Tax=Arsukibacterium indicum TaxID=2848612 RepID=A0ABS6MG10_9GAMM|nr:efflux RND transporter periplasmic adaptor subunit [Arsukibacterium indicum]MBV2127747.1 efflux RND transporter periplasmic adaptor subunit [Arsukibacterium indicum]
MKKLLIFLVIAAVLVGLISLSQYRKQQQTTSVTTALVVEGALADSILASGNLEFNTQIQIRSEVTGRVLEVLVEEGETVAKDQVLMRLDDTAFAADVNRNRAMVQSQQIDIARAKAQLADLQRQFSRQQQLHASGLVQQETIDSLQSQLDIANINVRSAEAALQQGQAMLAMAEDNLSKTVYRAPIAGLLATVDIKPGETVIAGSTNIIGSPLMTLADPSAILAELRVDEADIANVHLGQQAEVFAAAYPHQAVKGEVIQIATSARYLNQSQSLSFRVKVLLQPEDIALYPGMSCRAEIIMSQKQQSLQVPIAAIQQSSQQNTPQAEAHYFVWKVVDNVAVKQTVTLGMATDIAQEVLSGLEAGDEVVVGPARTMLGLAEGRRLSTERQEY